LLWRSAWQRRVPGCENGRFSGEPREERVTTRALVHEFGMGVECRMASETARQAAFVMSSPWTSSLPLLQDVRERGGKMLVDVVVGVPDPAAVDVARVESELPSGEVTVCPIVGGLRVPGADTLIACAMVTVIAEYPS
jgi:hypothetical protein